MAPGRVIEAVDKAAIKHAAKKEEAQPPASASALAPTPTTAAEGAARSARLLTMPSKTHPTRKMRALVWRGKKSVAVVDGEPRPAVTDPTDAVVAVRLAAICGSDLHMYNGTMAGMKSGDVIGHEAMGVVESVGPGVAEIKVGDRVAMAFDIACGACWFCQQGFFSSCDVSNPSATQGALFGQRTAGIYGYSHSTGGHGGTHAEFVRVPFADVNLLPLAQFEEGGGLAAAAEGGGGEAGQGKTKQGAGGGKAGQGKAAEGAGASIAAAAAAGKAPGGGRISDENAALLGDVLPTAWTACELGGVGPGDYVAIWGAGPIGLVAAQCAAHRGARRVVLIDPVQWRLDFARRPGVVLRGKNEGGGSSSSCRLDTVRIESAAGVLGGAFGGVGGGIEGALKAVAELSEGEPAGAPDVCIEAVGQHYARGAHHRLEMAAGLEQDSPEALNAAVRCVRKGGRVGVVGVFAGTCNHFCSGALMEKGLRLAASQAPVQRYWRELAAKVARNELDPSAVVTHRLPLAEAPKGFKMFDDKSDGCVKVLLRVGSDEEAGEAAAAGSAAAAPKGGEAGSDGSDLPAVAFL